MDAEFETELKELVVDGRKIEAIKLYRDRTGAGLREAKDAIDALEREGRLSVSEQQASSNLEEEIVALLERGRKIEAIKHYREQAGVGLKESKEAIEDIARRRGITTKSGCLGVILVGVMILIVVS